VDQLVILGEVLKNKMIIALLLFNFPESYNTLITALMTKLEANYQTCEKQTLDE